jgi:hypothetical protein
LVNLPGLTHPGHLGWSFSVFVVLKDSGPLQVFLCDPVMADAGENLRDRGTHEVRLQASTVLQNIQSYLAHGFVSSAKQVIGMNDDFEAPGCKL